MKFQKIWRSPFSKLYQDDIISKIERLAADQSIDVMLVRCCLTGGDLLPVSIDYRTQARRILTFAIGGKATIPASRNEPLTPMEDTDYKPNKPLEDKGYLTFALHCAVCHGVDAIASGHAPDLRNSTVALNDEAFAGVVRDGVLVPNGMPRFHEFDDGQLAALRQYLRARAAAWRTEGAAKQ